MKDYTIEMFSNHFIEFMHVPINEINNTKDAFYAGAQTCFAMMSTAIQNKDTELLARIANELEVYKAMKEANYNVSN